MLVKTKHFGEIELDEEKILTFNSGIFGFEECKKFTILYNNEEGNQPSISWLQSLDMQELALPVINPSLVMDSYDPIVNDDVLVSLGKLTEDNLVILLTLTVPYDLTKMTTNLKAPIIINSDTKYGCQIVAENEDYVIKYPVYDKFNNKLEKKGEM
jgi:flagellar assembly factor FliW